MNDTQLQLGERIRRRRLKLGLSICEVARRTGYHRQTIAEIEHGRGGGISGLLCILEVLGLKLKTAKNRKARRA